MFGNVQIQKLGLSASGTSGPFATGWYGGSNFVADPKSPNGSGNLWDALSAVIPNSGQGTDLKSFSVIASGNFGGSPAGAWTFNICFANPPQPALTPEILSYQLSPYPKNPAQSLPLPSASATQTVGANSAWSLEADVTVLNGRLSGAWALSIDGSVVQSGSSLTNVPTNLNQPIAAYLQIQLPPAASVAGVVLAVSVVGFSGAVRTLNL